MSDHNLVTIKLIINNQDRGKGYWKLNCSLLGEADYAKMVKNTIAETAEGETEVNPMILWEIIKCNIRGELLYMLQEGKNRQVQMGTLLNSTNVSGMI